MSGRTIAPTAPRMLPGLTPASRPFWTGGAKGALRLLRDKETGRWAHPFEDLAQDEAKYEVAPVSGKGKVFTFTVNHQQYNPAVVPPYVIALVELDEQDDLRIPTNIVNCAFSDLRIGMPVKVVFEPHGDIFVPLFEPDR